jgi:hypothetical protein
MFSARYSFDVERPRAAWVESIKDAALGHHFLSSRPFLGETIESRDGVDHRMAATMAQATTAQVTQHQSIATYWKC